MTLAAAVVALTLARQDGVRDDAVLAAVGASLMMHRRLAGWQAAIVVGIGSLLGAVTGSLAAYALSGIGPGQVFAMPLGELLGLTVGLTLAIA